MEGSYRTGIHEGAWDFYVPHAIRNVWEMLALWDGFPLFSNNGWGQNANIEFLKKHMGASFEKHPQRWIPNITLDDIHSRDFLTVSKIRGQWGGFKTLEVGNWSAYARNMYWHESEGKGFPWLLEDGDGLQEKEPKTFALFLLPVKGFRPKSLSLITWPPFWMLTPSPQMNFFGEYIPPISKMFLCLEWKRNTMREEILEVWLKIYGSRGGLKRIKQIFRTCNKKIELQFLGILPIHYMAQDITWQDTRCMDQQWNNKAA
eukprot:Gb_12449 [translate_table: standard]